VLVNQVINKTIHREMESENTGFGKKKKHQKLKSEQLRIEERVCVVKKFSL